MTLLVYGKPGTGYFLQSSPRLASVAKDGLGRTYTVTRAVRICSRVQRGLVAPEGLGALAQDRHALALEGPGVVLFLAAGQIGQC